MASGPNFSNAPNMGTLSGNQVSVTNTNKDGTTGTYATIFTAGKMGAYITGFLAQALGVTTATIIRLFVSDSAGANLRLFLEIAVTAVTPSGTVLDFTTTVVNPLPFIPANAVIKASIDAAQAQAMNVFAIGGDL
jgi:hypothetical protein